jgi:hypothetical protein
MATDDNSWLVECVEIIDKRLTALELDGSGSILPCRQCEPPDGEDVVFVTPGELAELKQLAEANRDGAMRNRQHYDSLMWAVVGGDVPRSPEYAIRRAEANRHAADTLERLRGGETVEGKILRDASTGTACEEHARLSAKAEAERDALAAKNAELARVSGIRSRLLTERAEKLASLMQDKTALGAQVEALEKQLADAKLPLIVKPDATRVEELEAALRTARAETEGWQKSTNSWMAQANGNTRECTALEGKVAELNKSVAEWKLTSETTANQLTRSSELRDKSQRELATAIEQHNGFQAELRRRLGCLQSETWYETITRQQRDKADLERDIKEVDAGLSNQRLALLDEACKAAGPACCEVPGVHEPSLLPAAVAELRRGNERLAETKMIADARLRQIEQYGAWLDYLRKTAGIASPGPSLDTTIAELRRGNERWNEVCRGAHRDLLASVGRCYVYPNQHFQPSFGSAVDAAIAARKAAETSTTSVVPLGGAEISEPLETPGFIVYLPKCQRCGKPAVDAAIAARKAMDAAANKLGAPTSEEAVAEYDAAEKEETP